MKIRFADALCLSIVIAFTPCATLSQNSTTGAKQLERNIRAELGFLASDAMQGRRSGSGYERLAAEYIGSQFRQFGLEPAGDPDSSGKLGFVQHAILSASKFTETPILKVTSRSDVKQWMFGKDFLVSQLRSSHVSGDLQLADTNATFKKGAVVLIKLAAGTEPQKRQELVRRARAAQVAAVLLPETDANKSSREAGNVRLPNLATRIQGDSGTEAGFATISLSKEAFDSIASIATGATVEFGGPTESAGETSTWNAVGMLRGSDPRIAKEVIMLSAHLDHLGTIENAAPGTDAIFNGADDDASGCVAVLELARALASGKRPKRTVYFVCFGSEERGGYGAQYFIAHSPVPLEQIVADVTFEMLGRPDAKVPANTLWLTGYERSTLGPELARQGALLVADPHPEQNFFQRSDNYTLALRGVVAHTVSSFGLHSDYHRPSDEVSKIDFSFMTRAISSLITPIRWLANSSFRPAWLPGQAPTRG